MDAKFSSLGLATQSATSLKSWTTRKSAGKTTTTTTQKAQPTKPPEYKTGTCNVFVREQSHGPLDKLETSLTVRDDGGATLFSKRSTLVWGDDVTLQPKDTKLKSDLTVSFPKQLEPGVSEQECRGVDTTTTTEFAAADVFASSSSSSSSVFPPSDNSRLGRRCSPSNWQHYIIKLKYGDKSWDNLAEGEKPWQCSGKKDWYQPFGASPQREYTCRFTC